jgi:hypothetical protein
VTGNAFIPAAQYSQTLLLAVWPVDGITKLSQLRGSSGADVAHRCGQRGFAEYLLPAAKPFPHSEEMIRLIIVSAKSWIPQ